MQSLSILSTGAAIESEEAELFTVIGYIVAFCSPSGRYLTQYYCPNALTALERIRERVDFISDCYSGNEPDRTPFVSTIELRLGNTTKCVHTFNITVDRLESRAISEVSLLKEHTLIAR